MSEVTMRADWIDGRTCPALTTSLRALAATPATTFAGPDAALTIPPTDTPAVTVTAPPAGGQLSGRLLRRDTGGPISKWWRTSSTALEDCWQAKMPYVAGAYDLRAHLSSAVDEVEAMRP